MPTAASSAATIGPLTTTFTPPPECSSYNLYYDSELGVNGYWGEECTTDKLKLGSTGSYASSCYPSGYGALYNTNYRKAPDQLAVYSPGLQCPHGWTGACTVERSKGHDSPPDLQTALWGALNDGETAIGCCPKGFTCYDSTSAGLLCRQTLSVGERLAGNTITSGDCGTRKITITNDEDFFNSNLFAPQINLVHASSQKSDGGEGNGKGSDKGNDDSSGTNNADPDGSGLSKNAIIAIGVCVPLVLIAIGIAVFFIVRRQKKKQGQRHAGAGSNINDPSAKPELEASTGPATPAWHKTPLDESLSVTPILPSEMRGSDADWAWQQQQQQQFQHVARPHELRGSEYLPPELGGGYGPPGPGWSGQPPTSTYNTDTAYELGTQGSYR